MDLTLIFFLFSQILGDEKIWNCIVELPSDRVVLYRYLIVSVEPQTETTHIRSWETHLDPRSVQPSDNETGKLDTYGDIQGDERVDRGWLTTETIVQFKFFNNPFILKEKVKHKQLYVKVSLIEMSLFLIHRIILFFSL